MSAPVFKVECRSALGWWGNFHTYQTFEEAESEALRSIDLGEEGPGTIRVFSFDPDTGERFGTWGFEIEIIEQGEG